MQIASLSSQVVTAPMSSINAIAVEAFKKYILVSLIQNRQSFDIYYMNLGCIQQSMFMIGHS